MDPILPCKRRRHQKSLSSCEHRRKAVWGNTKETILTPPRRKDLTRNLTRTLTFAPRAVHLLFRCPICGIYYGSLFWLIPWYVKARNLKINHRPWVTRALNLPRRKRSWSIKAKIGVSQASCMTGHPSSSSNSSRCCLITSWHFTVYLFNLLWSSLVL